MRFPTGRERMSANATGPVIITGAASGIGLAMALGLARDGVPVVLMDRSEADLQSALQRAEAIGDTKRLLAVAGDITSEDDAHRTVEQTLRAFGDLRALVNNAGIGRGGIRADFLRNPIRFWEMSAAQWRRFLDVNVTGPFIMTNAALPSLREAGWGRIVTVTTSLDTMIVAGATGYGSSKAALEATMATLAHDLAGSGVTANVLVPGGPVNTPMFRDDGSIPRDAFIQPEVMVPPLRWLLSRASDAVNGRRFVAARWNASLEPALAAEQAGAPIAWPQLGAQAILPKQQAEDFRAPRG
jgi:NAD(P)-dependent dehydrogenase (short-subunit alcohol dehydrogenase family)